MLIDELGSNNKKKNANNNNNNNNNDNNNNSNNNSNGQQPQLQPISIPIIRSQSRIESNQATERFLLSSTTTTSSSVAAAIEIMNDDRILACALYEKDQIISRPSSSVSSVSSINDNVNVVLITSDKVLTGKSHADNITVYNPNEFVSYYNKRMKSLKSRRSK